jgi:hypothetical protein
VNLDLLALSNRLPNRHLAIDTFLGHRDLSIIAALVREEISSRNWSGIGSDLGLSLPPPVRDPRREQEHHQDHTHQTRGKTRSRRCEPEDRSQVVAHLKGRRPHSPAQVIGE